MSHFKRPKYKNKSLTVQMDGKAVRFDSQMEYERYVELTLLQKAGCIQDLSRQVSFPFENAHLKVRGKSGRVLSYRADAVYNEDGKTVVEDTKGYRTPEFSHKWALAKALYPNLVFRCVTKKKGKWEVTDW